MQPYVLLRVDGLDVAFGGVHALAGLIWWYQVTDAAAKYDPAIDFDGAAMATYDGAGFVRKGAPI